MKTQAKPESHSPLLAVLTESEHDDAGRNESTVRDKGAVPVGIPQNGAYSSCMCITQTMKRFYLEDLVTLYSMRFERDACQNYRIARCTLEVKNVAEVMRSC